MAAEQLSPKQLIFATEYLKDRNGTQAAIRAGYSEKTAREQASRLLANVNIKQIVNKKNDDINRDLRELFAEEAVNAFKVLKNLMLTAENENVQLNAAKDFLDRAGYKAVEKISAEVTHRSYEDQLSELDDDE